MWRKIRKAWTILGVVFAAAFAIFFAYDWLVNAPHAKSIQTDLKLEFDSIGQLPGAERRDHYVSRKTQQALVVAHTPPPSRIARFANTMTKNWLGMDGSFTASRR